MSDKKNLKKLFFVKIITFGTEPMDQKNLSRLCKTFPKINFKPTYGMSEIGILRIKSKRKNSLFISIGGEGIETKVESNILKIRSKYKMMGYLNSKSPFDKKGWFNTNDIVEKRNNLIKILGRTDNIINIGGLKFIGGEVEEIAAEYTDIKFTKVIAKQNPITGQHIELLFQTKQNKNINLIKFRNFLSSKLPNHMVPAKIIETSNLVSHRFKKK